MIPNVGATGPGSSFQGSSSSGTGELTTRATNSISFGAPTINKSNFSTTALIALGVGVAVYFFMVKR